MRAADECEESVDDESGLCACCVAEGVDSVFGKRASGVVSTS